MLAGKERIKPGIETVEFLRLVVASNRLRILPINADIAMLSSQDERFRHNDPVDRIIAATALHYKGVLITSDKHLKAVKGLKTIW